MHPNSARRWLRSYPRSINIDQGGEVVGMPFMRYLEMTDQFLIDAGVPTADAITG